MDTIPIKIALLNALYQYLMTRPMGEVEVLVQGLRDSEPAKPIENTASDRVVSMQAA